MRQQVKAVERITATMGLVDVAKYPDKTIVNAVHQIHLVREEKQNTKKSLTNLLPPGPEIDDLNGKKIYET